MVRFSGCLVALLVVCTAAGGCSSPDRTNDRSGAEPVEVSLPTTTGSAATVVDDASDTSTSSADPYGVGTVEGYVPPTIPQVTSTRWTQVGAFDPEDPEATGRFRKGWVAGSDLAPLADYYRPEFYKDDEGWVHFRGPVIAERAPVQRFLGGPSAPWSSVVLNLPPCARPAHLAAQVAGFIDLEGTAFTAGAVATASNGDLIVIFRDAPVAVDGETVISFSALIDGYRFEANPEAPPC